MVTLEQVSRRVFADSSWFVKTVVGAFLIIVPGLHFFAFGYIYRQALVGRLGQAAPLPEWDDWRGLFVDGLRFFLIVLVLAVAPILAGWIVSLPLHPLLGPLSYMPMVPGLVLSAPLTAAGVYRFQRREDFRDAFRFPILFRMIVRTRDRLVVPTLAFLGLLFVLFPLFPYALFTGGVVIFYYYALTFHLIEAGARASASSETLIRR